MTLIVEPVVSAIVHMPCDQAKALVLRSGTAVSARSAVQAGVQIAELNPPAKPTPPIALAKMSKVKSVLKAKRRYANVADKKPPITNHFLPYLSAANAKGTIPIVVAIADTAVTRPTNSAEYPILFK